MIIKEITIRNFLSYYEETVLEISSGLTLIIGENGDGKTSFYDACRWLLDTSELRPNLDLFSAKKKADLEVGETARLSVSMTFEHRGEKHIEKSFTITRTGTGFNDFRTGNFFFDGYEVIGTERRPRPGDSLVNTCFDAFMQRFSMFKGESQLDVLNDSVAFRQLIQKYSDLKDFEDVVSNVRSFSTKAFNALEREKKNDKKTRAKATEISTRLADCRSRMAAIRKEIKDYYTEKTNYENRIEVLERNKDASEKFKEVDDRLKGLRTNLSGVRVSRSSVNLNTSLLDRQWILCAFPDILEEFHRKVSDFGKLRKGVERTWIADHERERGKKEALREIKAQLGINDELHWDIPDKQTMERMIEAETCWVCGHPAPKGSPEYNYMVARLENYNKRIGADREPETEYEPCYRNNFFEGLHALSVRTQGVAAADIGRISGSIEKRLQDEVSLDALIDRLNGQIEEMEEEKARILVNSDGLTEDMLLKNVSDYIGLAKLRSDAESKYNDACRNLKKAEDEEEDLKTQMSELPGSGLVNVYDSVNDCFAAILKAFEGAKEANLTNFLKSLEDTANAYQSKLNAADFCGIIRLVKSVNRRGEPTASIELKSSNGEYVHHKSGSQETAMYMSVLFAISELTTIGREVNYPLFFDAPTSPFGNAKAEAFYNVVDALDKQCIIVTKDFIDEKHNLKMDALDRLTCRIYKISKAPGYVQGDLSTVKTDIIQIK